MKIGDRHPQLNLLRVHDVDAKGNPTAWASILPNVSIDQVTNLRPVSTTQQ